MSEEYTVKEVIKSFKDISKLIEILRSGYDVNQPINKYKDSHSTTYLSFLGYAVDRNNYTITKILLKFGADPNLPCCTRITEAPLHLACDDGNVALTKLLLEHGANPKKKDKEGHTALYYCLGYHNYELLYLLTSYDIDNEELKEFIYSDFGRTEKAEKIIENFHIYRSLFTNIKGGKRVM